MTRWRAVFVAATALVSAALRAQSVPLLERIAATVSASHETTVRGGAGSVAPSSFVAVMNLHTGHYAVVDADSSGSFEARLFAAAGSSLLVKVDPDRRQLGEVKEGSRILTTQLSTLGGTVLQVPDSFASITSTTASGLGFFETIPPWVAQLRLDKAAYARGEPLTIDGTYTFLGSAASGQTPQLQVVILLMGISRSDGRGTLDRNTYCSTVMTPTGLPIERGMSSSSSYYTGDRQDLPLQNAGDRLTATFRITTGPIDLPDGYYRVLVQMTPSGVTMTAPSGPGVATRIDGAARRKENYPYALLPVIKIGNPSPPRLYWTLLANNMSQGARGVTAVEDRNRFAVANRTVTASERFVIPRVDPRTGAPIRYDLEPFALTIAASDSGEAINWPTIPFRFPSGTLTVSIRRPSGGTTIIGPASFRQPRLHFPLPGPLSRPFDSNHLADPFQLTTLDERFQVTFAEEGTHEITVSGSIEDLWGHVYTGGGTYVVDVGRTLEIESAVMPGTPLEIGNSINPSVQLLPAVPADVEVRYRFALQSRRDQVTEQTLRTRANEHGYAALDPIALPQAGEYRMDIQATYRDEHGNVWSGARTWGAVVAQPSPPIELHGLRGVDDQPSGRQAWFSRAQIGLPKDTGGHVNLAFHSGDVMWLADNGDAATLRMGIDDRLGLIPNDLLQRDCGPIEDKIVIGEAPFKSWGPDQIDPHIAATTDNDLWAYAYRFVQRPRVRVREVIAEECIQDIYWRFDDRYGLQSGTGTNGDLPNDFKFQFGGIALSGRVLAQPVHSIYGSLFIVIRGDDPAGTRVFPPFQGNGGLPSGGPLFTLKNRAIDIFFHPTAVRPGTILDVGAVASFTGQIGPTLPSNVEIMVTSPSGLVRTITGKANKIGYFYKPATNFVIDEPGVWRARVKVWHDGAISAGAMVTAPFPAGDVLGSRDGEFYFYAVDTNATRLRVVPPARFVQPALKPVSFVMIPPSGLQDVEVYYTTTMPGFILEEGKLAGLVYTYDAKKLAADFPNLDLEDADGLTGVDTITLSFLLSGKDAGGTRKYFARHLTLQGEEILAAEPRRRSVRH